LIHTRFNKRYGISGIHRLLHALGYSYQSPILVPIEKNPESVTHFLTHEYPRIQRDTIQKGGEIFFADESGFQSIFNGVKTWGEKGVRPRISHTGRRFTKGVISALTPSGTIRFMQYDGGMNQDLFILFLKRLLASTTKPVSLIVDGLPAHKGKRVKDFVSSVSTQLTLYFLPGYSPDLNPDELVWSAAKRQIRKTLIHTKTQLEKEIASYMHRLQKTPTAVRRFFDHPCRVC
jgi:transposase